MYLFDIDIGYPGLVGEVLQLAAICFRLLYQFGINGMFVHLVRRRRQYQLCGVRDAQQDRHIVVGYSAVVLQLEFRQLHL